MGGVDVPSGGEREEAELVWGCWDLSGADTEGDHPAAEIDRLEAKAHEVQQKRGWGFHHFGISCADFDADVAHYRSLGHEMALYGVAGVGARAAYMDTLGVLPGMIELIEMTEKTEAFFAMMKAAAEDWDGSDPVRMLGPV